MNKNNILLLLIFISSLTYCNTQSIDNNYISNNTTECKVCTDIVGIINGEIHIANSSISIIENIVKEFCSHLIIIPIFKKECNFIINNIQKIINYLLEGLSPKDICIKLNLCSSNFIHQ
mgnify:CR=1 FL=1|tara:strand:- start:1376 stop:1732 length:357 start_codon:yes stop_codon:yes gene_type:complete